MSEDKLKDLKNILLGDDIQRFDTKFMEFGDQLKKMSDDTNKDDVSKIKAELETKISGVEGQVSKLQKDVKSGFDKIIDTINSKFGQMEEKIEKNTNDAEVIRKKFDGFKTLFSN